MLFFNLPSKIDKSLSKFDTKDHNLHMILIRSLSSSLISRFFTRHLAHMTYDTLPYYDKNPLPLWRRDVEGLV